jgi:glycosyltransferase involved in cell wall biosynthesis
MKVTVAIAAYNAAATIQATLDSVLRQTVQPYEILVVNDGSTDDTASILTIFKPDITVLEQSNKGLSYARNVLCKHAQGELIAFLDADDVWHPRYLEVQCRLFNDYPNAVAFFTGHVNFKGQKSYEWEDDSIEGSFGVELIDATTFFKRYSKATAPFASPSYCCVPKRVLMEIGSEPFDISVRVCDDAYLFYSLALLGPVVYTPICLAAYRFTQGSLSSNRIRNLDYGVYVFDLLDDRYKQSANSQLLRAFKMAYASKQREYAKVLMGAGRVWEARVQLRNSLRLTSSPESIAKSLGLLLLTWIPTQLQPAWPSSAR